MSNKKQTSHRIASTAAKVLNDPNASATAKKLAGSALSQANRHNETGKEMEKLASQVLQSDKYNNTTQQLAASVLSQSDKSR